MAAKTHSISVLHFGDSHCPARSDFMQIYMRGSVLLKDCTKERTAVEPGV